MGFFTFGVKMGNDLVVNLIESSPITGLAIGMLILFTKNMAAERRDRKESNEIFANTINNHLSGAGKSLSELAGVIREMKGRIGD